jgi:hypothetical protein
MNLSFKKRATKHSDDPCEVCPPRWRASKRLPPTQAVATVCNVRVCGSCRSTIAAIVRNAKRHKGTARQRQVSKKVAA